MAPSAPQPPNDSQRPAETNAEAESPQGQNKKQAPTPETAQPVRQSAADASKRSSKKSIQSVRSTASKSPGKRPLAVNAGESASAKNKPVSRRPLAVGTPAAPAAESDDSEENQSLVTGLSRDLPAWLVSLVFHLILIVVIALLTLPGVVQQAIVLDAVYAEVSGEQLIDDTFDFDNVVPTEVTAAVLVDDLVEVQDPWAAPPKLQTTFDKAELLTNPIEAPAAGHALNGREPGMKEALLAKYGGTALTENAVLLGLEWLARNQRKDGTWSLKGPYSDAVTLENVTAATAMALLAFQGAGHTDRRGRFKDNVRRGWEALLKRQGGDGDFYRPDDGQGPVPNYHLYTHAQALIAVCEMYAMTGDPMYLEPAQKAVKFAVEAQAPEGGWRYYPGQDSDLSVTGWFVLGLQSAQMAGIKVEPSVWEEVDYFLDTVQARGGSRYMYRPDYEPSLAMTAEGLLCRQFLGWPRNEPKLIEGIEYLNRNPVDWSDKDFYYWYYAAQATHHMEGELWDKWNRVMRQVLPENQVKSGKERGSWDPQGDRYAVHAGRLYSTCMCLYMLEVYYRHLPIYQLKLKR